MVRTPWKSCISPLQQNRTENNFLTRVYNGLDTVEILYQPTATEQNRKQFPNQGLPWSGHRGNLVSDHCNRTEQKTIS